MRIEYLHASKYGNGARVAEEFARQARAKGAEVAVHHIRDVDPRSLEAADLYVFSTPGRLGKPIGSVRRFLRRLELPGGTPYAVLTTELAPGPDRTGGGEPAEPSPHQRVRPIMDELLQGAGLVKTAEAAILVAGTKGPLEDGWVTAVQRFVDEVVDRPDGGRT